MLLLWGTVGLRLQSSTNIFMIKALKKKLYFTVAHYFAFWAKFVLRRWKPKIIIITGSSGKTTALHLVEAQLGNKAVYSHHANGAIGIPFHILGLETNVPSKPAWLIYFLSAPFHAFRSSPKQSIYVVEADCDRVHEGDFTSKLLKPEVTIWISVSRTHSMGFDNLVKTGVFSSHEAAIAHEFGFFVERASKLVLANGDQQALVSELSRAREGVDVKIASEKAVSGYKLLEDHTEFNINGNSINVPGLQPKKIAVSLQLINDLLGYLGFELDKDYSKLELPPGRSNLLRGKKNITIIDSTYNNSLDALTGLLTLFNEYSAEHKWLVVADLLEQGSNEKAEHEKLAELLKQSKFERLILLGKRTNEYTYPLLKNLEMKVESFTSPKDLLNYINSEAMGGETILFKGALGLEGVIEQLLNDPSDSAKLVRREAFWTKRRQNWGLPR
jgi:UDP-N-acetylmuramyl pentapeptide synthase